MNGRIPRHKVAEAIIVSIDQTKFVGGVELGNEFVEITIEKVLKPLYPLPRQFSGMRVLRDANNSKTTILWRVYDVSVFVLYAFIMICNFIVNVYTCKFEKI